MLQLSSFSGGSERWGGRVRPKAENDDIALKVKQVEVQRQVLLDSSVGFKRYEGADRKLGASFDLENVRQVSNTVYTVALCTTACKAMTI